MPCNNIKCISYLSSPDIREDISKGSLTCNIIKKINKNEWYEMIKIKTKGNFFFDSVYSVELIKRDNNLLYSYSQDPPGMHYEDTIEKRDNIFTGIKCEPINNNSCRIDAILTFGEFEMSQKTIVDSMVEHFELFKEALKK